MKQSNILYESVVDLETTYVNVQYHEDKKGLHPGIIVLIVIIVLLVIIIPIGVGIKLYLVKKAINEDKMEYIFAIIIISIAIWMKLSNLAIKKSLKNYFIMYEFFYDSLLCLFEFFDNSCGI